jgi:hypothetical protein
MAASEWAAAVGFLRAIFATVSMIWKGEDMRS